MLPPRPKLSSKKRSILFDILSVLEILDPLLGLLLVIAGGIVFSVVVVTLASLLITSLTGGTSPC